MKPIDNLKLYNLLINNLNYILSHNNIYKPSIVFDIDGTIISDKVYAPASYSDLIEPIYYFYKYCMNIGINIFIITARPAYQYNIEKTVEMLQNIGLTANEYYFCRHGENQSFCKYESRKNIFDKGYTVVMSLGDNIWDIGKYGGMGILVNERNGRLLYDVR